MKPKKKPVRSEENGTRQCVGGADAQRLHNPLESEKCSSFLSAFSETLDSAITAFDDSWQILEIADSEGFKFRRLYWWIWLLKVYCALS